VRQQHDGVVLTSERGQPVRLEGVAVDEALGRRPGGAVGATSTAVRANRRARGRARGAGVEPARLARRVDGETRSTDPQQVRGDVGRGLGLLEVGLALLQLAHCRPGHGACGSRALEVHGGDDGQ
jgi:hypothetical protein